MTLNKKESKAYDRNELLQIGKSYVNKSLSPRFFRVSSSVWKTINQLGIARRKSTARGKKGGKDRSSNSSSNKWKNSNPNRLTAAILNCRSVCNKAITIHDYIIEKHLDFICLTETWLKDTDNITKAELVPPGYSLVHKPRPGDRRGGGVGILYRNTFRFIQLNAANYPSFEHTDQTLSIGSCVLRVIVIYKPPSTSFVDFINDFSSLLEHVLLSPGRLLILGDFNIHVDNYQNTHQKAFLDILDSFNLVQHVKESTHTSGHILDLVITRCNEDVTNIYVDQPQISDHSSVCFQLSFSKPPLPTKLLHYRKIKSINREEFNKDIKASDLLKKDFNDVNDLTNAYNNTLSNLLDKHAPLKSKIVTIHPTSPWYTPEIHEAKKVKRKAERIWRRTKLTVHRDIFITERNKVNKLIIKSKKDYYANTLNESSNIQRDLYKCVNTLLNKNAPSKLPDSENNTDLCNSIVTFFSNKIKKIENQLKEVQSKRYSNIDTCFVQSSSVNENSILRSFYPVSEEKIRKLISSSASKSCILDPIPTYLLKECLDTLLPIITRIINLSLQSCTVPDSFKTAAVTPLLKKASLDPNCFQNYRPVSNLPFLSKILEKVVLDQINTHKSINNLNEKFQSAYRKYHSTETALLRINNDLLQSMDKKQCCFLVLLDLSAAFDTVNHNTLLNRLSHRFGIKDDALAWITSYLENRSHFVTINNARSAPVLQHCNVPQGSVLGPTFFSDYISPLSNIFNKWGVSFHSYADDTQIYIPFQPGVNEDEVINRLTRCIHEVRIWMAENFLKLNDDKTDFILIGNKFFLSKCKTKYLTVGDHCVPVSTSVKNIGASLDSSLSMATEVNSKCKSAWWQLYQISKIKSFLTADQLKTVTVSLVLSKLDQNNSLLHNVPDCLLAKLQRVQNSAARMLCSVSRHTEATPLLVSLHWLPIRKRITFKILLLVYKCLSGIGPLYLTELLSSYTNSESRQSLRSSSLDKLLIPLSNNKFGNRSFVVSAPGLWNILPVEIRCSTSVNSFKKSLKTFLFQL